MLKHVFVATISCLAINIALAQQDGTGIIHGTVINETGQYVPGANVRVHNTSDHRIQVRPIRYVETDKDGKFTMDHLDWGLYKVYALKETELYPDSGLSSVYANGLTATANLSAQAPSATVVVTIGPKAAKLTGSITDGVTGKPITNAGIRVWRWNEANDFILRSTKPNRDILVPANIQVGIEIQAPGYELWRYPGAGSNGQPLLLKPAETLNAEVRLQPKAQ